ncbi:proteoglycan 4 isoform X3 [Anopheles gambiae]|uniref:Chitin-binding type-2 domain-containing protein n=1 Tax=Anopheles gambiae TaxID=7165 RepID=A0ABK8F4N8_ANOGA|nr:proteoglycan 4 isoform X3 [Anopheles gambiae]
MNGFRVLNFALFAFCFLCFSVGDELGLAESLGNVEANKRRALNIRTGANNIGVLPASKMPTSYPSLPAPIVPSPGAPIQQSRPQAVTVRSSAPMLPKGGLPPKGVPSSASPVYMSPASSLMTKATSLPLGVPPFRPIPKPTPEAEPVRFDPSVLRRNFALKTAQTPDPSFQSQLMNQTSSFHRGGAAIRTAPASPFPSAPNQQIIYKEQTANLQVQKVPAFQAMPESVSRISTGPVVQVDNKLQPSAIKNSIMSIPPRRQMTGKPGPTIATGGASTGDAAEEIDLMGHTVEELAAAANVSVEVIKEAIRVRQQELRAQKQYEKQQAAFAQAQFLAQQTTPATTTTTTTTPRPRRYPTNAGHKVMNAPKEYYPVGYDKNFDDNFTSKVDLPYTTFNCGEQKHFPGLYGDEDLGCMVFHVCALTDDGLIMKSFLCPESTLFDQTVLKCNWWFYVDCKSSKNLYDSNLPVSKSYQLMKALSFFSSNYKNPGDSSEGVDVEALKNSVATAVAVGGSARSLDSLSSNTIAGSTGERFQDLAPAASESVRSQSNNTTVVSTPSSSSSSTTSSSSKTTTST